MSKPRVCVYIFDSLPLNCIPRQSSIRLLSKSSRVWCVLHVLYLRINVECQLPSPSTTACFDLRRCHETSKYLIVDVVSLDKDNLRKIITYVKVRYFLKSKGWYNVFYLLNKLGRCYVFYLF